MGRISDSIKLNVKTLFKPAGSIITLGIIMFCLVALGGIWTQVRGQQGDGPDGPSILGSWDITITTTPNPPFAVPFRILRTVGTTGVVDAYAFPSITPTQGALVNSAGHGNWTKIGPREYSVTVEYFQLNPNTPLSVLDSVGKVRENIRVSRDGRSYSSVFETDIYLPNGTLIIHNSGKTEGRRIPVEPLSVHP